jgi:hypothetical protein
LPSALPAPTKERLNDKLRPRIEGVHYATCEASVEAKGWKQNRTGVGSGGSVPVCRGRLSDDRWTGSRRRSDAKYHAQSASHPRRRGSLRRQSGDVLCLRQGNHSLAGGHHAACQSGRLRMRTRLRRTRLRMRTRLRLFPRMWLRWLRLQLLSVMGRLPMGLLD